MGRYGVSEQRACRLYRYHRSTHRYQCVKPSQEPLRMRLRDLAHARPVLDALLGTALDGQVVDGAFADPPVVFLGDIPEQSHQMPESRDDRQYDPFTGCDVRHL